MRILITGTGGRLGRLLHAAKTTTDLQGNEIFLQSRSAGRDVKWAPGDDPAGLPACDVLVALWGRTSGPEAVLAQNEKLVGLSRRVATACGARLLVHLSSAGVYGPGARMAETTPTRPVSAYGAAKLAMEAAIDATRGAAAPAQIVLRLANVVGADSLAPALHGVQPITLDRFADGRGPLRSYIGAPDLLRILVALANTPPEALPDILNVAAPEAIAMEDLANAAQKRIIWRDAPESAVQEVTLDVTRMTDLIPRIRPTSSAPALIEELRAMESLA